MYLKIDLYLQYWAGEVSQLTLSFFIHAAQTTRGIIWKAEFISASMRAEIAFCNSSKNSEKSFIISTLLIFIHSKTLFHCSKR